MSGGIRAAEDTAAVTVASVKGTATVKRADGSQVAAVKGLALKAGEVVSVAPGGAADLGVGEGNTVRLAGGSTFRVGQAQPKGPVFDLLKGELLAKLAKQPPGRQVTVRTPTGVAGVEGTTFRVHLEAASEATEVTVVEGKVGLASAEELKKQVLIAERQTARSVRWKDAVLRATGSAVAGAPPGAGENAEDAKPTIVVTVGVLIPTGAAGPEAAEAAAEQQAHDLALAELANRLARHRIDGDQTLGAVLLSKQGTLRNVLNYAAKAAVTGRRRTDDGRLAIELTLDLKGLSDLVGAGPGLFTSTIRELSRVEYGKAFGGQRRLMAEGAARQDAQRKLVERIYGVVIDAKTTVKDLAVDDDTIRVRASGLLRGARAVATRYFADGTVEVDMEVTGANCVAALDPERTGRLGAYYLSTPESADLGLFIGFHDF